LTYLKTRFSQQIEGRNATPANFKLPVAARAVFGGFVKDFLIVCGGFKSHFDALTTTHGESSD
jgi:hypothetical protein